MKVDILTLFPKMFEGFLSESILGRAIKNDVIKVNLIDFREFSKSKHKKVDDSPYGGGAGMVLGVQSVYDALISIDGYKEANKILLTPQGKKFEQDMAYRLSKKDHIIILCGHYEGYDERIRDLFDCEASIGDFVLTGGEIAAMVMIDAITRVIPGVISKDESHLNDSFSQNLLEHPHYTRPSEFMGKKVPEVLISGHHKNINEYREEKSKEKTEKIRPDLLED